MNLSVINYFYWALEGKIDKTTHINKMQDNNHTTSNSEMDIDECDDYSQNMDVCHDCDECPVCSDYGCTNSDCVEEMEKAEYYAQYWADF